MIIQRRLSVRSIDELPRRAGFTEELGAFPRGEVYNGTSGE